MATIVERPMFSIGEIQNNMEGVSRRNSVEIIDVDAHDDPPASSLSSFAHGPPRARTALRMRHSFHPDAVISLVDDSDDEVEILSDPVRGSRPETSNRRRLRSPPPYSLTTPPPPVPSIPRRYAAFTPFPAGRGPPPALSAPPVRPHPQPFAFEQNIFQRDPSAVTLDHRQSPILPPFRRTTVPQVTGDMPSAAPPSHHVPSMGLGGALISSNNARAQLSAAQAARAARMTHAIRRRPMSWLVAAAPNLDDLFHDQDENPPHIRRWLENQRDNFVRFYNRMQGQEESQAKYHQRYTHPEQPEPGFTFDFAPNSSDDDSSRERLFPPTSVNAPIIIGDDDEHPSMLLGTAKATSTFPSSTAKPGKLTTILVCAKCTAPLLLNESLGPDDSGRRVWALRCGHMIDEQCLNDIGQPDEEPEPGNKPTLVDRKGKGKARLRLKASYGEAAVVAAVEPVQSNNIRSRLRSAASTASSSSSPSVSLSNQPPPPTKRRRTATVRKIEAEFEWKCPVPSCHLVHASVKIDGKWGPEKEAKQSDSATKTKARGALPVFA